MKFSLWLETIERNHDYWERFFLGIWSLDKNQDGLSKNLKGFDTNRLVHTSEFQNLSPPQQQEILNRIAQGNGTVGDLVDIATGESYNMGGFD
jgi:hypothetical protein